MNGPVAPPPPRGPRGPRTSATKPDGRLGPVERGVLLALVAAAGVALLVRQGPDALEGWRSRDWPVAQGVLTAKRHYGLRKAEGEHVVEVRYAYPVGDARHEGFRRGFGIDGRTVSAERAEAEISALPAVGQPLAVHHDPKVPERSLLEPGVGWRDGLGVLVGALLLAFALGGLVRLVGGRAKRA